MAGDACLICSLAGRGSFVCDCGARLERMSGRGLREWLGRSGLRCRRCDGYLGGRLGR